MCETRNSSLLGKITVVIVICCCCLPAQSKYGGGSGTSDDPYLIYDANQMSAIGADANDWSKHFRLMADIDLSGFTGTSFNIIGYYVGLLKDDRPFRGVFDGDGHTISNFNYSSTDSDEIGLFGYVYGRRAEIKNLGLIDPNIDAGTGDHVGSLVGSLRRGTINNCYVVGGSVSGDGYVGGLIGRNYEGTVEDCYSVVSITGDNSTGGLVGYNSSGTIANSYSSGPISGNGHVGGLVGDNHSTISKCFATGNVSGKNSVGGLVGYQSHGTIKNSYATGSASGISSVGGLLANNHYGTISNCYSVGHVSGKYDVGGMLGRDYHGIIMASFWDGETSGRWSSAAGEVKTTSEMKDPNTFISWGSCDDEVVWILDGGNDYPRLAWEGKLGQPLGMQQLSDILGGTGTEIDPYIISTDIELQLISLFPCEWDKHFILVNDVSLAAYTGMQFNIIGNRKNPFNGVFDGQGHRIWNFSWQGLINRDYIGLFARLGSTGTIRNLGIENVKIVAERITRYMGSLVGLNEGTLVGCYSTGSISGEGDDLIGGLVGCNKGTITNCYAIGSTSGWAHIGGLVGQNDEGTISGCYAEGSVSGDIRIGGLAGTNRGAISNSYATCSVYCDDTSGGLVGTNSYGTISHCYAAGAVTGSEWGSDIGGLVGDYGNSAVTTSFWDIETSGQTWSNGGTGKTTAEMKKTNTFLEWGACGSEGIWTIDEGMDYPRLFWENAPGEPITKTSYGGGSGELNDPYLIYTAEQINKIGLISCHLDKHFKLMADIDLSGFTGTSFNIIGTDYDHPFTGVFDGNGHTISNFTYTPTSTYNIGLLGLFGRVDNSTAEIKDLGLIDPNVDTGTGDYVGSLVGKLRYGTVSNCYIEGGSVSGDYSVGGLVGWNEHGIITKCSSIANVSGDDSIGGQVGWNHGTVTNCCSTDSIEGNIRVGGLVGNNYGTIENCYSKGSVYGNGEVGGLAGVNSKGFFFDGILSSCYSTGTVEGYRNVGGVVGLNEEELINSYFTGNVSGVENVGGLVGKNSCHFWNYGKVSKCYSTGSVSGTTNVGGLIGLNDCGMVNNAFWDIETSGQDSSDGGTGIPTAQMQMASTFIDSGWDFVGETFNGIEDNWFIPQQDYPHLWWEGMQVPMKLTPRTLNCRSEGSWVKSHLTLPEGFTIEEVDSDRPAVLHSFGFQSLPLYVFVNKDKLVEIEAAFERDAFCSLAGDWPQELTVAGFLGDGNIFLGTSTVRIIHPGMKMIDDLASYWLNADCVQPDFCDGIDINRDSLVNLLDYALLMNINIEFVTDE